MAKTSVQLGIRLDPETDAAVRAAVARSGLKINAWVEAALRAAAEQGGPPDTPPRGGRRARSQEPARETSRLPAVVAPPEAESFATAFLASLKGAHPGFKAPTPAAFRGWVDAARLMLAANGDERPLEEAQGLAAWLFNGQDSQAAFWRGNVLSVPKFRQQYDQLAARWRQQSAPPRTVSLFEQQMQSIMDSDDLFGRKRHAAL